MEEQVTISKKEYERLLNREAFLDALEAAGVDNWSGIGEAFKILREESENYDGE
ncbi:host recbcd nuclease inhibitor [Caudoviricetes sp.]|nr:host recbcd nuclease inhibitor [Caudoviricetes sp.]UOF79099.1 host recbcd nuclease inhibitor [Caudoviricetes sp.]